MAVPADLLFGQGQLASPELALVDADLAAELRSALSPVEDSWLRPRAPDEGASAESGEKDPAQVESAVDAGHSEQHDDVQLHNNEFIVATPEQTHIEELRGSHYPVLPAPEHEEAAFEDSPPRPVAISDGASSESDDDALAQRDVAEVLREAEERTEQLLIDDNVITMPERTPAEERTSSHYPVLPAPEPDAEATDADDAAFRRIRERLTEADKSPPRKRRIRRGFTLASGVVAAHAVAALGADVQLHLAQLPSWLQF